MVAPLRASAQTFLGLAAAVLSQGGVRRELRSLAGLGKLLTLMCDFDSPLQARENGEAMSLGIAFKGAEGVVLAADSRVTLMAQNPAAGLQIPVTYDSATKLLRVSGQKNVGAVTYGVGAIGGAAPRTAHSYIPEFEAQLLKDGIIEGKQLSVAAFAKKLSDFFMARWQEAGMPVPPNNPQGNDMVFLVGGYNEGEAYGHVYEFYIPTRPKPVEQHKDAFGMVWGGQREYADRLIGGFDSRVPELIQQQLGIDDAQRDALILNLRQNLQAPIPFEFLPLQDCVDVAIFLIRTTIEVQGWLIGVRGVGGAIDVATITRIDGFQPIQEKTIRGER